MLPAQKDTLTRRFQFRKHIFWAEEGMIWVENQDDGETVALTLAQLRERALDISLQQDVLMEQKTEGDAYARDQYVNFSRLLEAMHQAYVNAKAQGDPTDETVRAAKERAAIRTSLLGFNRKGDLVNPAAPRRTQADTTIFLPGGRTHVVGPPDLYQQFALAAATGKRARSVIQGVT
jgi:hypothetical protein